MFYSVEKSNKNILYQKYRQMISTYKCTMIILIQYPSVKGEEFSDIDLDERRHVHEARTTIKYN